jgi:hypothetical protein
MAITNKNAQIKEIIKCGKEPVYFFNRYVKIQHPTRGTIPFDTFSFQDDCVNSFNDHRFNIILKSRQLGMSTLVAAYAVWLVLFQKDKNVLIIATKLSVAQNFIKKVKTVLRNMPKWLILPEVVSNNKQLIEFSHGSSIKAIPTSDDAGRSEALSLLIVDEAAFVKNFDELWMGLYPTISTGGRVILLSTPNGVGGQYHKLYVGAESGSNEFNPIKIPWDAHPERDNEWFKATTANLSKRQVSQEYLCDFATSGETFLTGEDIDWVRSLVQSPVERMGPDRNVWVWKYPLSDHNYIVSADIARGDSKDFSTFHIIDSSAGEVVAEYKGKIPPDRFGDILNEFGIMYNKALLIPENNSYGYATIVRLRDLGYPRMYHNKRKGTYIGDYVPAQDINTAGFTTSGKSRNQILTKLEEVIRNKSLKIYSSRFSEEIKTFAWKGAKAQAAKGYNDDLVMSLAIGVWVYDASDTYGHDSNILNEAMLKAMSRKSTEYEDIDQTNPVMSPKPDHMSSRQEHNRKHIDKRQEKLLGDLSWLYK